MHKLDPISPHVETHSALPRERETVQGPLTAEDALVAPSHDVGEPCIMSWPHYLSTTICSLFVVSSFSLLLPPLTLLHFLSFFLSLSLFLLCSLNSLPQPRVYLSLARSQILSVLRLSFSSTDAFMRERLRERGRERETRNKCRGRERGCR